MIDWFYLVLLTLYGKLGGGCYLLENSVIKTVWIKVLERSSSVNIFWDRQL